MTVWQRLTREPALILGVVTAGLSLAVLCGVNISAEQIAQGGVFLGALLALLRFVLTPSAEVIAQEKPDGQVVAGAAAWVDNGREVEVRVKPTAPAAFGTETVE